MQYALFRAAPLVLLALYALACCLYLRTRPGTLAWIAACDQPLPPVRAGKLGAPDVLPMLAVCLLAGVVWALGATPRTAFSTSQTPQTLMTLLVCIAAPVAASALTYALCKRMFDAAVPSALAAALVAVDLSVEPTALAFSAAGFFFLVRALTLEDEARFRDALLPLAGCFAFLGAGCYFDMGLCIPLAAALLAALTDGLRRALREGRVWLVPCLLTAALSAGAALALIYLPGALNGDFQFPTVLLQGVYYRRTARQIADSATALTGGWWPLNRLRLQYDGVLILSGLAAMIAAVVASCRRRARWGALLLFWFASQGAAFWLMGLHALSLPSAVCLCALWTRLQRRGGLWLAALGAGLLLAVMIAQSLLIFYYLGGLQL